MLKPSQRRTKHAISRSEMTGSAVSTNGHEISFLLHDGHRFDFDQELRPEKPRHLNGGAGRWILKIDLLFAYISEFGQTGEIQEVAIQFDYVAEAPACRLKSRLESIQHLL